MIQFLLFAFGRYASFFSHLAAFIAGLSLWVSLPLGIVLLAVALLLGSLSSFFVNRSNHAPN